MEEDLIRERYELSGERIARIPQETDVKEPYREYFVKMAQFASLCKTVMDAVLSGEFAAWDGERLKLLNRQLYEDILPGAYEES